MFSRLFQRKSVHKMPDPILNGKKTNIKHTRILNPNGNFVQLYNEAKKSRKNKSKIQNNKKNFTQRIISNISKRVKWCNFPKLSKPSEIPKDYWNYTYKLENTPDDNTKKTLCRKEKDSLFKIQNFIDVVNQYGLPPEYDKTSHTMRGNYDPISESINDYDRSIWHITHKERKDKENIELYNRDSENSSDSENSFHTANQGEDEGKDEGNGFNFNVKKGGKYNKNKSKGKKQYTLKKRKFTVNHKQR